MGMNLRKTKNEGHVKIIYIYIKNMSKHKGGKTYFSKASDQAEYMRKKKIINDILSRDLRISLVELNKSPQLSREDDAKKAQKIQARVRGLVTRNKKNKRYAKLAQSTLKSTVGIGPSLKIKRYLVGKKRKSRKTRKTRKSRKSKK